MITDSRSKLPIWLNPSDKQKFQSETSLRGHNMTKVIRAFVYSFNKEPEKYIELLELKK